MCSIKLLRVLSILQSRGKKFTVFLRNSRINNKIYRKDKVRQDKQNKKKLRHICNNNSCTMTKIQNNKINFVISNNTNERQYSLVNGEFYINDHKITTGQPSDVRNGAILRFDSNGELNFRIGRKRSKDIANWFNGQCDPNKNTTFGHPAKRLNFAFIGTLQLTICHELEEYKVSFNDILIAQSQTGTSNNWWFGGKNCFNISNHTVVSNSTGNNFRFTFLRGGNTRNADTVEIANIEFITWMNYIDENRFLSQINIPGAHNSGTYNFNKFIFRNYVKTQNLSITDQLNFGIRFLDIRCRHINNAFAIHHDRFYCNLTFGQVLKQCISFLQEYESECIILLIKEEHDPHGNTREFHETFLDYANENIEYWYRKNTIPKLKEARRKIVLLYRFDFKENAFGINVWNWKDNATFTIRNSNSSLMIQDEYSVKFAFKSKAVKDLVDKSNKREKYWYINYISLAPTLFATIADTSNYTNAVIYEIAKNNRNGFLGSIIMDYPNVKNGLTSAIIDSNIYI